MTLVEVMLALTVIIVAVLALFSAVSSAQMSDRTTAMNDRALAVIQRTLEQIQADPPATVAANLAANAYDADVGGLAPPGGRPKVVAVRPQPQPAGVSGNLIAMTIDAKWTADAAGSRGSLAPITYYYVKR
jgi:hypothetical protein